jgi:PAT family beta-lactamase induction signal transducer AmpG
LDIGFSKNEIAAIAKTLGVFSNMAGALVGGISLMRLGINRSLWVFGIFQALSTLSFCILNYTGHNNVALGGVIIFEDMSAGMGSAAFMAYMASMANKSFTATQYALMTSLMGVPMTIIASPAGEMVKLLGWNGFFVACTVAAIPGLLLLRWMTKDENVRI